jgi:hypothetical protein
MVDLSDSEDEIKTESKIIFFNRLIQKNQKSISIFVMLNLNKEKNETVLHQNNNKTIIQQTFDRQIFLYFGALIFNFQAEIAMTSMLKVVINTIIIIIFNS